jgi:hypothetical protein
MRHAFEHAFVIALSLAVLVVAPLISLSIDLSNLGLDANEIGHDLAYGRD